MHCGEMLKTERVSKGLSLRAAADVVGIDASSISKIERGLRHVTSRHQMAFVEAYDLDIEQRLQLQALAAELQAALMV